jgi:hypothetical protein
MRNIELKSEIFWVKIVDFLQQNWALIEIINNKITVFFIQDSSIIFDEIEFNTIDEAEKGLLKNGFKLFLDENENFQEFISPPKRPFTESSKPFLFISSILEIVKC